MTDCRGLWCREMWSREGARYWRKGDSGRAQLSGNSYKIMGEEGLGEWGEGLGGGEEGLGGSEEGLGGEGDRLGRSPER